MKFLLCLALFVVAANAGGQYYNQGYTGSDFGLSSGYGSTGLGLGGYGSSGFGLGGYRSSGLGYSGDVSHLSSYGSYPGYGGYNSPIVGSQNLGYGDYQPYSASVGQYGGYSPYGGLNSAYGRRRRRRH